MNISPDRINRFHEFTDKSGDCWLWKASVKSNGYGQFWINGKNITASRVAFFIHNGYEAENCLHSCDNPRCVNPAHLRSGSLKENSQDASKRKRFPNSMKTHCPKGHELSGDNLYANGKDRTCKKCNQQSAYSRYLANRK